jgi:hypothetical protein
MTQHISTISPTFPPVAEHFKATIPFTNDLDESLQFFIEGISASLLLDDRQLNNILTLYYLGYLIFNAVKSLYATFPQNDQFPHELTKIKTRFCHHCTHFCQEGLILCKTIYTTTKLQHHLTRLH